MEDNLEAFTFEGNTFVSFEDCFVAFAVLSLFSTIFSVFCNSSLYAFDFLKVFARLEILFVFAAVNFWSRSFCVSRYSIMILGSSPVFCLIYTSVFSWFSLTFSNPFSTENLWFFNGAYIGEKLSDL